MPIRFANLEELPCDERAPHDSMITLRLPRETHELLKAEADNLDLSLNALVLLKVVAECWGCRIIDDGKGAKRPKRKLVRA